MSGVYIIMAHPNLEASRANKALIEAVKPLTGVTLLDLYHAYQTLIDVAQEQQRCEAHDVIILQHPYYWYSTPPLMKQWLDQVLEFNWAYGPEGKALKQKIMFQAITSGSERSAYTKTGRKGFSIEEFNRPMTESIKMCCDRWWPPFLVSGINQGLTDQQLGDHATRYATLVEHLLNQRYDEDLVVAAQSLNEDDQLIQGLG